MPMNPSIPAEEQLFLELARSYALCRRVAEEAIASAGITLTEYNLLRVVENDPDTTATAARERLMATAPSVAQVVKSVEAKGLMVRTRAAHDARNQHMRLTPRGRTVVRKARAAVSAALQASHVPASRLRLLTEQLASLSSSVLPLLPHPPHGSL
jgi:DNA-binding MarR family transcriptional regulator